MELLFVYGTLKRNHRNNVLLSGYEFLGEVRTVRDYKLINCGTFPGLQYGCKAINGELYRVDDNLLERLDCLEGTKQNLYTRDYVQLEDGTQAYAYLCNMKAPDYDGTNW